MRVLTALLPVLAGLTQVNGQDYNTGAPTITVDIDTEGATTIASMDAAERSSSAAYIVASLASEYNIDTSTTAVAAITSTSSKKATTTSSKKSTTSSKTSTTSSKTSTTSSKKSTTSSKTSSTSSKKSSTSSKVSSTSSKVSTTSSKKSTATSKTSTTKSDTTSKKTSTTPKVAADVKSTSTSKKSTTTSKKSTTTTKKGKREEHAKDDAASSSSSSTITSSTTVTISSSTTSSAIICTETWTGGPELGYAPSNNTAAGFMVDATMNANASAQSVGPAGYTLAFIGQLGEMQESSWNTYLWSTEMTAYNTTLCGSYCSSYSGCNSFNIYYERQSLWEPTSSCTNPNATAGAICTLWSAGNITNATATNFGQYRDNFAIVATGSNGYNLNYIPPSASSSGFLGPSALSGAISQSVNVTASGGIYLGNSVVYGYNVSACAVGCENVTTTYYNAAVKAGNTTYQACNYFTTFNATYSGVFQFQVCEYFNSSAVATSTPVQTFSAYLQSVSSTVSFNVTGAFGYNLYPQNSGITANNYTSAPQGTNASCASLVAAGGVNITDYNGDKYTMACGYDVLDSDDIGNAPGTDFYTCFNLCDNFPKCSGFSYNWDTCYFKNMTNSTRVPLADTEGTDFAWMPADYAGFSAGTIAATVTYYTSTTSWTGSTTATSTSFNSQTAVIWIEKPGAAAATSATTTVTLTTDSGTASTVGYTTATAANGKTVTVTTVYPTPSCNLAPAVNFAVWSNAATYVGPGISGWPSYQPTTLKTSTPLTSGLATFVGEYNAAGATSTYFFNTAAISTVTSCSTSTSASTSVQTITSVSTSGTPVLGFCTIIGFNGPSTICTATTITSYRTSVSSTTGTTCATSTSGVLINPDAIIITETFYIYAGRGSGYYTFASLYAYDIDLIWTGVNAVSGWTRSNAAISSGWTYTGGTASSSTPVAVQFFLVQGQYLPVRVNMANFQGAGELDFTIQAPDGSIMMSNVQGSNTGFISGQIINTPCGTSYSAFPAWGNET